MAFLGGFPVSLPRADPRTRPCDRPAARFAARVLAALLILLGPALSPAGAARIWTDGDGDGLPDSAPFIVLPGANRVVGLWIDSETFAWTNYLAYVEWTPGRIEYVSASYVISDGTNFPIDDFSHPSGVGFSGMGFDRQGIDHVGDVVLHMENPLASCVAPITDPGNDYGVFSQLGRAEAYVLFASSDSSCYSQSQPATGACCFPSEGACSEETEWDCAAAGGIYQGDWFTCEMVACPDLRPQACCFDDGSCADKPPADCVLLGGTPRGVGTVCGGVVCPDLRLQACCFDDGSCADKPPADCVLLGGTPRGVGTACGPTTCDEPEECSPGWTGPPSVLSGALVSSRQSELIKAKGSGSAGAFALRSERSPAGSGLVGGDDIGTAISIGTLPYWDSRNTCGYADDYDAVCPYMGSTSGDVVYSYAPTSPQRVTLRLCNSAYDTKIYVYENSAGNMIACNDDACNDPSGNPFRSMVTCVFVRPGDTYYIVVDGYGGDCGEYCLAVVPSVGCAAGCDPAVCPPGALFESEPLCGENYVDDTNGGCGASTPRFSTIPCAGTVTVCGESGTFLSQGLPARDTDWYQLAQAQAGVLTASLCADFPAQLAIINSAAGCGDIAYLCGPESGFERELIVCTAWTPDELMWIFVAPSGFEDVPCGSKYTLRVETGCIATAVESTSWGRLKGLFR